jgi:carbon storage regulator
MIGSDIEISIVDIQGDQIRLGIEAPRNITIHRKEVFEEIIKENKQAASVEVNPELIKSIKIKGIENKKSE